MSYYYLQINEKQKNIDEITCLFQKGVMCGYAFS